jgi:hypothetical protein
VKLVHFYDEVKGVPSELEANAKSKSPFFPPFFPFLLISFCLSLTPPSRIRAANLMYISDKRLTDVLPCSSSRPSDDDCRHNLTVLDETFPQITIDLVRHSLFYLTSFRFAESPTYATYQSHDLHMHTHKNTHRSSSRLALARSTSLPYPSDWAFPAHLCL